MTFPQAVSRPRRKLTCESRVLATTHDESFFFKILIFASLISQILFSEILIFQILFSKIIISHIFHRHILQTFFLKDLIQQFLETVPESSYSFNFYLPFFFLRKLFHFCPSDKKVLCFEKIFFQILKLTIISHSFEIFIFQIFFLSDFRASLLFWQGRPNREVLTKSWKKCKIEDKFTTLARKDLKTNHDWILQSFGTHVIKMPPSMYIAV